MTTNPRVWLTVDIDNDDIIVREDGRMTFIDVGNFKEFTPAEKQLYEKLSSKEVRSL